MWVPRAWMGQEWIEFESHVQVGCKRLHTLQWVAVYDLEGYTPFQDLRSLMSWPQPIHPFLPAIPFLGAGSSLSFCTCISLAPVVAFVPLFVSLSHSCLVNFCSLLNLPHTVTFWEVILDSGLCYVVYSSVFFSLRAAVQFEWVINVFISLAFVSLARSSYSVCSRATFYLVCLIPGF